MRTLFYAARGLRRNPGFTITAVSTLVLAVGANAAIFSLVRSVLLKPLAYGNPERLVVALHGGTNPVSPADYLDYKRDARGTLDMAAAQAWDGTLQGRGKPEALSGLQVSASMFDLLQVHPSLGRSFRPEEDAVGTTPVLILSDSLWQRRFGADRSVLGQTVNLSGSPYTIIGVMPPSFQFAPFWQTRAEMWTPLVLGRRFNDRGGRSLRIFGRLHDGVTLEKAQAMMTSIAGRLAREYPAADTNLGIDVLPLQEKVSGPLRPVLLTLLATVVFVLLIACVNVGNLTLTRAIAREREVAVRTALGASRRSLFWQAFTESLLLAGLGGAAGFVLGAWGLRACVALLPPFSLPRQHEIGIDWQVWVFTLLASQFAGVLCGLAPALHVARGQAGERLRAGRGTSLGFSQRRVQSSMIVAEVALALVLVVGAGLMIRTIIRLSAVDPGFSAKNVLTLDVSLAGTENDAPGRRAILFAAVTDRVGKLPGVKSVGAINHLPLAGDLWRFGFTVEGRAALRPDLAPRGAYRVITPEYFRAMGIQFMQGREFTAHDDEKSSPVVIVNHTLAAREWPDTNPIGKRITLDGENDPLTVVGVVNNVRQSDWTAEPGEEMYLAYGQRPDTFGLKALTLVLRTSVPPEQLRGPIEREILRANPELPVAHMQSMERVIEDQLWRSRVTTILFGAFAGVALLLAAVGIYGVIAYSVRQRREELGIRIALGATPTVVLCMTLGQGMRPVFLGVAIGMLFSAWGSRLMQSFLFRVSTLDKPTFLVSGCVLLLVAALANLIPAQGASRIDPALALRNE